MRRGLLLAGFWALGVVVAVTLAFAAVGRVASGVAPNDVARLSQSAIDSELTAGTTRPSASTTSSSHSIPSSSTVSSSTTTTTTRPTDTTVIPPLTSSAPTSAGTPLPTTVTTASVPPPPALHNTVTTSQGGTIFTRCSGPDTIVYVAAVPRTGYERTVDLEATTGIRQSFVNARHQSNIEAECSNGVVHAQVEEESLGD